MTATPVRRKAKEAARAGREQRRRHRFALRIANARTNTELIGAAADHLRAVVADLPPAAAERITHRAVTALNKLIDDAYREEKRQ